MHFYLVWASLWSDRAMLYRSEIGLSVRDSTMAVIVQEFVEGQRSGVAFGASPMDESAAAVEAVHGLNQGLVDGTVEPDRWIIDRSSGAIRSHTAATREKIVVARSQGITVAPLPRAKRTAAPLSKREVCEVYHTSRSLERVFAFAQDVEWTYRGSKLRVLQSRPITTATGISKQDNRPWYLSLHRSLGNLMALRESIEATYVPEMISVAKTLADQNLAALNTEELAEAIRSRKRLYSHWQQVYWDYFIPFAHAVRLFGQIYNRVVKPKDPYEFVHLLSGGSLRSVDRNRKLIKMASAIESGTGPRSKPEKGQRGRPQQPSVTLSEAAGSVESSTLRSLLATVSVDKQSVFLEELAKATVARRSSGHARVAALARLFIEAFPVRERKHAEHLLDLARASYKLRDDDNIYLGRIEAELLRALVEAGARCKKAAGLRVASANADQFIRALTDPGFRPPRKRLSSEREPERSVMARQLTGQPAGEGVVVGRARVVKRPEDLLEFKRGEILVCDAVDPNMTFVVPLAGGIVERRGGMLIHGAIIAREYGLPCVTGVPDASRTIRTGDRITVDGYLGIITVGSAQDDPTAAKLAKPKAPGPAGPT